jgi:hypothetical protein
MSLTLPTLITEGFGTGDAGKTNPIPVASQIGIKDGAASFTDGFPPLTRTALGAGGIPPDGEDMQGILYMITALQAWMCSGQPFPWSNAQSTAIGGYGVGATVINAAGDGYWLNTTANNTTNPDAGGAGWVPAFNYGATAVTTTGGTVTLTLTQIAKNVISVAGALTSNATLVFPASIDGDWIVANNTTGAFTLVGKVAGGTNSVSIPQAGPNAPTIVYSNGTDLLNANVSTAGLAPIASPALTGVPTAPNAPSNSNTTQIATTAFSQAAIAAAIAGLAPLASPTLSGSPTAPTAAPGSNNALLANTAFVHAALAALTNSQSLIGNGWANLAGGLQLRWGSVAHTVGGVQAHTFGTAFSNACFVVIPVVASSTGVEFFTVVAGTTTASGWQQYSNNTTTVNYIAVGF